MNCLIEKIKLPSENNTIKSSSKSLKSSKILIILVPLFLIVIMVNFICICLTLKNNKKINQNIDKIDISNETTTEVLG